MSKKSTIKIGGARAAGKTSKIITFLSEMLTEKIEHSFGHVLERWEKESPDKHMSVNEGKLFLSGAIAALIAMGIPDEVIKYVSDDFQRMLTSSTVKTKKGNGKKSNRRK